MNEERRRRERQEIGSSPARNSGRDSWMGPSGARGTAPFHSPAEHLVDSPPRCFFGVVEAEKLEKSTLRYLLRLPALVSLTLVVCRF